MAINPGTCASCGVNADTHEHHLVPRAQGGDDGPTVHLCIPCHASVHGQTWDAAHTALVRAGLARAASEARKGGRRPVIDRHVLAAAMLLVQAGASIRKAAIETGVSKTALYEAIGALRRSVL